MCLSQTENDSIHILDRTYIIGATITFLWSFKLGKVNEIYKEGKTIKILFKEVTSDFKYTFLYMVTSYRK